MKPMTNSAFSFIFDHHIMKPIGICTIEEANWVIKTELSPSIAKLNVSVAVFYAQGAYEANNLKVSFLWNRTRDPKFF